MSKNSSINTTPIKPIKPQKQNISKLFDIENFIINSGETKKFETEKFLIHNNITTPNFRKLTHSYYTNIHESSVKQVKHVKHKNLFLIIKFDKQRENFVIDNSNQFAKQHENISKNLSSKNVEQGDLKYVKYFLKISILNSNIFLGRGYIRYIRYIRRVLYQIT